MSKILICGDSFCVTDPDYPGLHWSEKILNHSPDFEVHNMSYGGCSNALILLQLLQGLKSNPDFVILSFTSLDRYELDFDPFAVPRSSEPEEISSYIKKRYTTNCYLNIDPTQKDIIDRYRTIGSSDNFERLKNYFYICLCLQTLFVQGINFCFSLGGFAYQNDYIELLNSNFLKNWISHYHDRELTMKLWYHQTDKPRPYFHVDNNDVHAFFADECIKKLTHVR